MGLGTGNYSFRFLIAQRTGPGGAWQATTPAYWPGQRDTEALKATVRRIWQQSPPLPLAQWEQKMTQPPGRATDPQPMD